MAAGIAYYDLAFSPPTYDAYAFLLGAELWRRAEGLDALEVRILPGPAGGFRHDNLPPFTVDARRTMLHQIVLPMARMLPSVRAVDVLDAREDMRQPSVGYGEARYGLPWAVKAARENCYPFRAPLSGIHVPAPYVTITLRESSYWPTRNSDLAEWRKVAISIAARGFEVLFVRDTRCAAEPIPDFAVAPEASRSLDTRMALYAGASLNLFVNNGPAWLCWFAGLPAIVAKMCAAEAPCVSPGYFTGAGIPAGGKFANARPRQEIIWAADTADAILPAVERALSGALAA